MASASGGFAGAIILYETALGVGIALGPLVGGELGAISWRGPFFGVTALMAIALSPRWSWSRRRPNPRTAHRSWTRCGRCAHRGLLTMGLTALCYNWAFFTVLGYAPFPMNLDTHQLGYVFTGWGVLVAIFAIFVAPRLRARLGVAPGAVPEPDPVRDRRAGHRALHDQPDGADRRGDRVRWFISINNTVTTQAVMTVAPVERPVASAAYGFIRFISAGLAPYIAGGLAAAYNVHLPFYISAGVVVVGIIILSTGHKLLSTSALQAAQAHQGPGAPGQPRRTRRARRGEASPPGPPARPHPAGCCSPSTARRDPPRSPAGPPRWRPTAVSASRSCTSRRPTWWTPRPSSWNRPSRPNASSTTGWPSLQDLGIPASSYLDASTGDHGDVGRLIARRAGSPGRPDRGRPPPGGRAAGRGQCAGHRAAGPRGAVRPPGRPAQPGDDQRFAVSRRCGQRGLTRPG